MKVTDPDRLQDRVQPSVAGQSGSVTRTEDRVEPVSSQPVADQSFPKVERDWTGLVVTVCTVYISVLGFAITTNYQPSRPR